MSERRSREYTYSTFDFQKTSRRAWLELYSKSAKYSHARRRRAGTRIAYSRYECAWHDSKSNTRLYGQRKTHSTVEGCFKQETSPTPQGRSFLAVEVIDEWLQSQSKDIEHRCRRILSVSLHPGLPRDRPWTYESRCLASKY
jgi:hypothetical protein